MYSGCEHVPVPCFPSRGQVWGGDAAEIRDNPGMRLDGKDLRTKEPTVVRGNRGIGTARKGYP